VGAVKAHARTWTWRTELSSDPRDQRQPRRATGFLDLHCCYRRLPAAAVSPQAPCAGSRRASLIGCVQDNSVLPHPEHHFARDLTAAHPVAPDGRDACGKAVSRGVEPRRGEKAIVFSQFTSLLAHVRARLEREGVRYEYLDGATRDRKKAVERFQTDADCSLFLVSLKAGGVGLNLTAANYVFLLDPWWNPAVEAQAIDSRASHRAGRHGLRVPNHRARHRRRESGRTSKGEARASGPPCSARAEAASRSNPRRSRGSARVATDRDFLEARQTNECSSSLVSRMLAACREIGRALPPLDLRCARQLPRARVQQAEEAQS